MVNLNRQGSQYKHPVDITNEKTARNIALDTVCGILTIHMILYHICLYNREYV